MGPVKRVVVAPDKFKGSLTALQVADALTEGMAAAVAPEWEIVCAPVADGGEGAVAAVVAAGWKPVTVPTTGPTGEPLAATYARQGRTAVVELAAASCPRHCPRWPPPDLSARAAMRCPVSTSDRHRAGYVRFRVWSGSRRRGRLVQVTAYDQRGFDTATATADDDVFRQLVLARIIEATSKQDSLRVLAEAGSDTVSSSPGVRSGEPCLI